MYRLKLYFSTLVTFYVIISACSFNEEVTDDSLSKSTMDSLIEDIKNDVEFEEILKNYYFNPEDILLNETYFLSYNGYYNSLTEAIKADSLKTHYFWNEDINDAMFFDYTWILENNICSENLLILVTDNESNYVDYHVYCFTEDGEIYSSLTIINPEDTSTIWLRNENEYIKKQDDGVISIEW